MGRGRSGKTSGKSKEDAEQLRDTIIAAALAHARYFEYVGADNKVYRGETSKAFSGDFENRVAGMSHPGGTLRHTYSERMYEMSKLPQSELKRLAEQGAKETAQAREVFGHANHMHASDNRIYTAGKALIEADKRYAESGAKDAQAILDRSATKGAGALLRKNMRSSNLKNRYRKR